MTRHGTSIFDLLTLTLKFDLLLKNFNHGFYLMMVAVQRAPLSSDNSYLCYKHLSWHKLVETTMYEAIDGVFVYYVEHRDLNGLNLPTHDRKHQLRARELIHQASNHLSELVQALSNFYTYSEQRSKIYPADGVNEQFSPVNVQVYRLLYMHHLPLFNSLKHKWSENYCYSPSIGVIVVVVYWKKL